MSTYRMIGGIMQDTVTSREELANLESGNLAAFADDMVANIRRALDEENADKSTRDMVEMRIKKALPENYIIHAREQLIALETGYLAQSAEGMLAIMDKALEKAEADASALDRDQKRSRRDMEKHVEKVWEKNREINPFLRNLEGTRRAIARRDVRASLQASANQRQKTLPAVAAPVAVAQSAGAVSLDSAKASVRRVISRSKQTERFLHKQMMHKIAKKGCVPA